MSLLTARQSTYYIIDFESHQYDTTANLQAGITWHLNDMMQLYGDMGYTSDLTEYHAYRVDVGIQVYVEGPLSFT